MLTLAVNAFKRCASDFELATKWLIVEEDPRIVVFSVPLVLELSHALHNS